MFNIGECFLMGYPGGSTKHLHVVINDPPQHNDTAIVINCTHNKSFGDELILTSVDHPWIDDDEKPTWVAFMKAMRFDSRQQKRIQANYGTYIIPEVPADKALVEKIVRAALESKYFPVDFRVLLR